MVQKKAIPKYNIIPQKYNGPECDNKENSKWDAECYHKIPNVNESWAIDLLEKRKTIHNEIALDAEVLNWSCDKNIAYTANKGKVYAVDKDANMIANAKKHQWFFKHSIHQIKFAGC